MITFEGVSKRFGTGETAVQVLHEFSLAVPTGQFCTIMGPSGAGKSTVLHLVAGLTEADGGEVRVADQRLAGMNDTDRSLLRRRRLGSVYQFFHLLPYLSAEENVMLPLLIDGHSAASARIAAEHVLGLVGLLDRRAHRPAQLSGGQMQRIAIARALVHRPAVVLADEPTGNLDSITGRAVMELLRSVNRQLQVTVLMVTHDPVCAAYGDRIVRLVDGCVVEDIDLSGASDGHVPARGAAL